MTTILFNLVLLALALDLIIWGIDQGWSLVNVVPMWHHQHGGGDGDGHA